jgi:hypothetical protein
MNQRVKSHSRSESVSLIISYLIGLFFALIMVFHGLYKSNLISFTIGTFMFFYLLRYILTWDKEIQFNTDHIIIYTTLKNYKVSYDSIESIKFQWAGFFSEDVICVKLKNYVATRKVYSVSLTNNKDIILEILNFSRFLKIPTGLNGIGNKFFLFDRDKNSYVRRTEIVEGHSNEN